MYITWFDSLVYTCLLTASLTNSRSSRFLLAITCSNVYLRVAVMCRLMCVCVGVYRVTAAVKMAEGDWDEVTVIRKRAPKAGQLKTPQVGGYHRYAVPDLALMQFVSFLVPVVEL